MARLQKFPSILVFFEILIRISQLTNPIRVYSCSGKLFIPAIPPFLLYVSYVTRYILTEANA